MAKKHKLSARQLAFPFAPCKPDFEKRIAAKLGVKVKVVYTDNTRTMISSHRGPNGQTVLRLHHMFRGANGKITTAISDYLKKRDRVSSELLSEFIRENNDIVRTRPRTSRPAIETRGEYHDLARYFTKLNETYFGGKLNAWITWGNRTRRRGRRHIRLGSYSFENRVIRIHPALDKKWVPRYYVESVVYHEMLHAHFGVRNKNGRACYHTDGFHEFEEAFIHSDRAREWEKKNIQRLI